MHPGLLDPFGACRSIGSAPAARSVRRLPLDRFGACRSIGSAPAARSIAFAAIACGIGSAETAGSNRFSGRRYLGAGSR
jgi:hypothetical protein